MFAVPRVNSRDLASEMEDDADNKPDDKRFAYRRDWSDEARDAECQRGHGADGQSFNQEVGVHYCKVDIEKKCCFLVQGSL